MLTALITLTTWWLCCFAVISTWKRDLFLRTWHEPYFSDTPVLIESDDWGPGGDCDAESLKIVLECLRIHKDSIGRCAVLTADIVLAVPDIPKIKRSEFVAYHRRFLDTEFPEIHTEMMAGIRTGTLVPQLHGLEHMNCDAFVALCADRDARVETALREERWWDWESLDSPLQGHYVDGRQLPTTPIDEQTAEEIISTAMDTFERMFGHGSISTVAPCYLWNSNIEAIWKQHGVRYIQTAGYRCTGRDAQGKYRQDPPIIRAGDRSDAGQRYLVRNVMYEPVDGRNTPLTAMCESRVAFRQALPITISTHRYNYTRSAEETQSSINGLNRLLTQLEQNLPNIRYLSSPELGSCIDNPAQRVINAFNGDSFPSVALLTGTEKVRPFLYRLKYRHPKLFVLSVMSGLILPVGLLILLLPPLSRPWHSGQVYRER